MTRYALRRLAAVVPLLLGVSVLLFALIQAAPGGPEAALMAVGRAPDPAAVAAYRERLGVDRPVPEQYVRWLGAALQGQLGTSYATGRPVAGLLADRLPATLLLAAAALLLAAVAALGTALIGALRPGSLADRAGTMLAFGGLAMPAFWFALVVQLVFGVWLDWLPVSGMRSAQGGGVADRVAHLVLPASVLSLRYVAGWSRYLRASLREVLRSGFVRSARARGLHPWRTVGVHALRNALGPAVSVAALDLSALVSGAVIIESVFAWPGLGRLFVTSMLARDYPVLMGVLLLGCGAVVLLNLVADLVHGWLDPRIRHA